MAKNHEMSRDPGIHKGPLINVVSRAKFSSEKQIDKVADLGMGIKIIQEIDIDLSLHVVLQILIPKTKLEGGRV